MKVSTEKLRIPLTNLMDSEIFALLNISEIYEYVDGKRTANITEIRYTVANPDTFENFDVKVAGSKAVITQKQLEESQERIWVTLENAIVKPYKAEYGKAECTVTADAVKIAK